jgi:hypothetical protein
MPTLQPGGDGEILPPNTLIFRIGSITHVNDAAIERGEVPAGLFELSSEDKKSDGKRLSVWAEELTVADQAWDFMGSKPKNTLVACLSTDDVRGIEPPGKLLRLDVQWEKAMLSDGSPNNRPGAEGHCGICNLDQDGSNKADRRHLRMQLAKAAKLSPVTVPHRFDEEHLRVAAYFIAEKDDSGSSSESHWIQAVRQFRRARVREQFGST